VTGSIAGSERDVLAELCAGSCGDELVTIPTSGNPGRKRRLIAARGTQLVI